jgi:hypothetical protein
MTRLACFLLLAADAVGQVGIGPDRIIYVRGKPVFPIGFTRAPAPGAKTSDGRDAYSELSRNGFVFHRSGPAPSQWNADAETQLDRILDASARAGIGVAITLPGYQALGPEDREKAAELRRVVEKYRDHPGLFCWKGEDEPEWGKVPVEKTQRFYDIVHTLDPRHPVWMTQAPRGTIESLKAYDPAYDIAAIDIYPIGYPPGMHSHLPNKEISVVGDYAGWLREITSGRKPFWMVLQVCWSGVIKPGKTLRMPTFPQERYMTYQSIINGARGLLYFGGDLPGCQNERDRALGWNWTFYERVLGPLLEELRPTGPLYPALVAPESALDLRVHGEGMEAMVREAGPFLYVLASKREGPAIEARFSGLPVELGEGEVLFEAPRRVTARGGVFTDWFGPNEVHVYRFHR